ncbi:MAG: zinc ribbon domain-containing protein [Acidobacteria bacterium]|nr:zinc ribbon domain-containing protein [Acidobacteriota bacterium]
MYCPKCGQSQVADEVRYCSRCGFALSGVTQLLAHDGAWPQHLLPGAAVQVHSPRRKGAMQGGKLMLVGAFLVPVLVLIVTIIGSEAYEFVLAGVLILIVGIVRLLYALLFEDAHPAAAPAPLPAHASAPPQFDPAPPRAALPQQQASPAPVSFRTRETGELAGPPSVTENTTRLLDTQDDPRKR